MLPPACRGLSGKFVGFRLRRSTPFGSGGPSGGGSGPGSGPGNPGGKPPGGKPPGGKPPKEPRVPKPKTAQQEAKNVAHLHQIHV